MVSALIVLEHFISHKTIYDCFKQIVKEIGYPEVCIHDLRHTYATISLLCGGDMKTLQEKLGHAAASFTLDVYGHPFDFAEF